MRNVRIGSAALLVVAAVLAGVASASTYAPSAPLHAGADFAARCRPGHAVQAAHYMRVNGHDRTDVVLNGGEWIKTGPKGQAQLCLQQGTIRCVIRSDSKLQVLPTAARDVLMQAPAKQRVRAWCKARTTGKRKKIKVGGETITLGSLGLTPRQRTLASRTAGAPSGHLFSLDVDGKSTVVKVLRGATVVTPQSSIEKGVVLGRKQQVVAPRGGTPGKPAPIQLSSAEDAGLQQLGRLLPQDVDTTAPTPDVKGPTRNSSLRAPTFAFKTKPAEPGVVFSCSVDKPNDFRVCVDGQPFGRRGVGSHYVLVKATDAAGNTMKRPRRYEWSIAENPIVYARGPAGGSTDIWRMDSDGANQKRLTDDAAHARAPRWSPDHKLIAFDSDIAGNFDIYVMNVDGTNRRRLTTAAADELRPSWSPDGKRIAFELRGGNGTRDIYTMASDGTDLRRLTSNVADDLDPDWSPDGQWIAFASTREGNYDIWVIDAKGGQPLDITKTPDATEFGPAWSPNGKKIAYHRKGDKPPIPNDVYVMNPDGSDPKKITQTGWDDVYPQWAPDGREIVFYSARVPESKDADVYFVSLDVMIETRLTTDTDYDYLPDW